MRDWKGRLCRVVARRKPALFALLIRDRKSTDMKGVGGQPLDSDHGAPVQYAQPSQVDSGTGQH